MSKRFTDTDLNKKAWFRKMRPAHKATWDYLCRECDCAGLWSIDLEALAFWLGESVVLDELIAAANADGEIRLARFGTDKIHLVGFVAFQYGKLSETCKPHLRVISRLKEVGLVNPLGKDPKGTPYPLQRVEEEEEEEDKEEEEEEEGGVGGLAAAHPPATDSSSDPDSWKRELSTENLTRARDAWFATLARFKAGRQNLLPIEQETLCRAIQRYGVVSVEMACLGYQQLKPSAEWDPAAWLDAQKLFAADKVMSHINRGVMAHNKARDS